MVKPLGDWYLVKGYGDERGWVIEGCPEKHHQEGAGVIDFIGVGDRVFIDEVHAKDTWAGTFIHFKDILGVIEN